jgi:hypothetical protein
MRTLALTLLFLSASLSKGQDSLPPPPSPVLARLPEFASWTVTYRYADEGKSKASPTPTPKPNPYVFSDRKRNLSVIKTGPVWSEQTEWTSGNRTELWIYNNLRAGIVPGTKKLALIPFTAGSDESFDYRRMDFEGLDWIKPDNYRGPAKWQGQLVYFFEEGSSSAGGPIEIPVGKWGPNRWAVISPETRLPLLSYDGRAEREYRYKAPPTSRQVPPENFLSIFQKMAGPSR